MELARAIFYNHSEAKYSRPGLHSLSICLRMSHEECKKHVSTFWNPFPQKQFSASINISPQTRVREVCFKVIFITQWLINTARDFYHTE